MYSCIDYYLLPFPYSCNDGKIPISLCCRLTHSYLILIMITIAWGYRKWSLSFLGAFICFNWYIEIAIFLYIAPDFFSDFFSLFHWLISLKIWNSPNLSIKHRVLSRFISIIWLKQFISWWKDWSNSFFYFIVWMLFILSRIV
jgi:hypothetical protein